VSAARRGRKSSRADAAARGAGPSEVRAPWKRAVALAVVLLVAVWPLGHRLLVAFAAVNPWKLGGFAMYAAPAPPLVIALYGLRDGQLARIDPATLPLQLRASLQRFEVARHALGELRRPDALATEILAATPAVSQLSIVVQRTVLRPDDARLAVERMQYSYDRSGPRETRRMPVPTAGS
jgi:hypothetical protein